MRIAVLSLVILAAGACAATAQTTSPAPTAPASPTAGKPQDPIARLLSRDEDEPDFAGQPRGAAAEPDLDLTAPVPSGPPVPFATAPRSRRDIPVNIDQTSQTPDGPPDNRAQAYDARIRASFAAAQGYQGPLDGGWTLSMRDREYALQIVDRRDRLEAVWRDLRRTGALDASGVVDDIHRAGGALTLRIEDPGTPLQVTLREAPDGRWTGKATRGGETLDVTLRHTSP